MNEQTLSKEQVVEALKDIDKLAQEEYGLPLEALLESELAEDRMRRLAGVLLKRPFAKAETPGTKNPTGASRSWHWVTDPFNDPQLIDSDSYRLLEKVRDAEFNGNWQELQNITQEAGLMWAVGKWLAGQMAGDDKTFRKCYYDATSPEVKLFLNIANLVPFATLMAGVVGVPVLAVQLSLFAAQFGYEKLTVVPKEPDYG
jgi:hypothetical protein